MTEVVIAGGGLAGLVAARRLAESGVDMTLFERRDAVGGRVRSRREDGFVFDRGFQVLFPSYPAAWTELDLGALDLRSFDPGATIARPGHRSTISDPFRDPLSFVPTALNADVTVGDKLRTLALRRELGAMPPEACFQGPDESIRAYLERRGFSERFLQNFATPFYGGITLDRTLATDAGVFRYAFKMLTEGQAAIPAAGMGAISRQLAGRARDAGATIETGAAVTGVAEDDGGVSVTVDGETVSADAAVVATDPRTARDLTGVEEIPADARGCVTQYFGLRAHRRLDTGKKLVLNAGGDHPGHVAPLSAVAPEYAPADAELVSATTVGRPEESDAALAAATREALDSWYPEHRFDEFELLHTDRIEFAQFDQPPGFRGGLPDATAPDGPVVLAGDYTQWSSIQGALVSGRVAADAVEDLL